MDFEKLSKTIQAARFEKLISSIEDNPLLMELLELAFQAGAEKALEQRKPLTDEQFKKIKASLSRQEGWDGDGWDLALKEAIEAAHGIVGGTHE